MTYPDPDPHPSGPWGPRRADSEVLRAAAGRLIALAVGASVRLPADAVLAVAGWLDAVAAEEESGRPGTTSEARERTSAFAVARYLLPAVEEMAA